MKTTLKKILFISLLFSAAVPSAMQANSFLTKHPIAVGVGIAVGTAFVWKVLKEKKEARRRAANYDLWLAAKSNNIAKATQALANGAEVDQQDNDGKTALMEAAWRGNSKIVKLLLATNKVDVNQQDNNGETALMGASGSCYFPEVVIILLESGVVRLSEVVKLLLATNKVDINQQDNNGKTALMEAVNCGYSKIVKLLLATKKVDINQQDYNGKTTLMKAAAGWEKYPINVGIRQKFTNIIEQLLAAEADPLVKAQNGRTALDLNNETINEYMRKQTSGILKKEVASQLSLELPSAIAKLTSEFTY